MQISIEKFQNSDAQRCIDIRVHCLKESNQTPKKIQRISEYFFSSLPERTYFVAKQGDLIVGRGCYKGNKIYGLFIDPIYQGQGIGAILLDTLESEIKKLGYTEISLKANARAKIFYERHGFICTQTETPNKNLMKKNI